LNWNAIAFAVMLAIAGSLTMHMRHEQTTCENNGGTYVRAVFWFECVKRN